LIVAVVMGGKTGRSRDAQMAALIKRYINQASTGRRTVEPVVATAIPRPEIRPEPQKSVDVAAAVPLPTMKPETTGSVPTPPNSIGAIAAAATRESTATSKPAHIAAYAPIPDRGWIIQIAAVPDERDAFHLLNEARTKAHDQLASAAPYTEKISKGSTTLYRARFAGFEDKKTAWAACDSLKQRDFSCLALPQ
ncbi:MAG: SPOR domain-containing protein, partial [Hyphomicrobiales bacterium]|nr:SPOR domain-containing protein [Hyphomicrobiales bacterium]